MFKKETQHTINLWLPLCGKSHTCLPPRFWLTQAIVQKRHREVKDEAVVGELPCSEQALQHSRQEWSVLPGRKKDPTVSSIFRPRAGQIPKNFFKIFYFKSQWSTLWQFTTPARYY